MVELFANSGDSDQTPRSVASDLGLHCLQNTLLAVTRLQWVNAFLISLQKYMLWVLIRSALKYMLWVLIRSASARHF